MPTPRKPLEVHKAAGTLKPRHRDGGPPVCRDPIGPAPTYFSKKLAGLWDEIVQHIPAGLAAKPDRIVIEMAVILTARLRDDPVGMRAAELAQLRATLAQLGMTPGGRSLMVVPLPPEPENDPAAEFFK